MVGHNEEVCMAQVMGICSDSSDHSKEFPIICGVPALCWGEFLAPVSHDFLFVVILLREYMAHTTTGGVCLHPERSGEVRI